jgi:hypothetical protein
MSLLALLSIIFGSVTGAVLAIYSTVKKYRKDKKQFEKLDSVFNENEIITNKIINRLEGR